MSRYAAPTAIGLLFAVLGCAACLAAQPLGQKERVPFTVRDSIEFEQVVRQSSDLQSTIQANPIGSTSLRSPDGAHFVIQTRRGLIEDNLLQDTVWLVDANEAMEFLNGKRGSDSVVDRLLSRRAKSEWGVISNLAWLSDDTLAFIAADDRGVNEVFSIDIRGGAVTQLTSSATDVTSFAVRGGTILYYAVVPEERPSGYSISAIATDLGGIIDPSTYSRLFPRVDLFAQVGRGSAKRVAAPPMRLLPYFQSMWISPDARFAVAMQPAMSWPAHWAEYQLPNMEVAQYLPAWATADGTSAALLNRVQYRLIDIHGGTARALMDAPTGLLSLNFTPMRAYWMSDSSSVLVSGTFLPLTNTTPAERLQRTRQPAIAEVNIESGQVTPVVWEPRARPGPDGGREVVDNPIVALDFRGDQLTVYSAGRSGSVLSVTDPRTVTLHRYAKTTQKWRLLADPAADKGPDLSIDMRQDLNSRPKVYATCGRCQQPKLLWDPNPLGDRFSFASAQVVEWTDRNGIAWRAGLLMPPNRQEGERSPLVVQTHGFHADEFLLDGPYGTTTAFAAQPLANAGFAVLQVEENVHAETGDAKEPARYAEGMRSGIEMLVAAGVADATRVGAVGWSISGSYVTRLLSDHPDVLAAAVISDAAQFGYVPYLVGVNLPTAMRSGFERFADLDGITDAAEVVKRDSLHKWAFRAPPIRLEAIRQGAIVGMWETYAILRLAGSQVDLVYFPDGSHSLQKPSERMVSQQGTVDWLRFWLQNDEDPDSAKRVQYELWRAMRTQRVATTRRQH